MSPNKVMMHGWINLYKPVGLSSAKAVAIIRKQLNCSKIGHGGTLDPLACGVLPIALGEATKTASYMMDCIKKYEFTLHWGYETTTDDKAGFSTLVSDKIPTKDEILNCIPKFIGTINQVPPDYSAVKINGRRAYSVARTAENQGQKHQMDLKSRQVVIHDLSISSHIGNETCLRVSCEKGTYIRSLGRDLGRILGSAAHVSALSRLNVGKFDIKDAISLDFFKSLRDSADAQKIVVSLLTALDDIPAMSITHEEAIRIKMGQRIPYSGRSSMEKRTSVAICGGLPVALIKHESGIIRPIRVFNL